MKAFENGKSFIIGYEIQKHQNEQNRMVQDKIMKKHFFIKPENKVSHIIIIYNLILIDI